MGYGLNARSTCFKLVIEQFDKLNNKIINFSDIVYWLEHLHNDIVEFYALVLHDKTEDRLPHYHLVVQFDRKFCCNTVLNDLSKYIMCNVNCISIMLSSNLCSDIQYLTHEFVQDKADKYDYDFILTNDEKKLHDLYNGVNDEIISIEYIVYLCEKYNSLIEVYAQLGIQWSQKYWRVIDNIYREVKLNGTKS